MAKMTYANDQRTMYSFLLQKTSFCFTALIIVCLNATLSLFVPFEHSGINNIYEMLQKYAHRTYHTLKQVTAA